MNDISYSTIKNELDQNGWVLTKPVGNSMYPMLRYCKDPIIVQKPTRPFKVNDVPVYVRKSDKSLVMHRIIAIKNGNYIIRGDNCLYKEYGITDNDIIGILAGFYRGDKFFDCEKNRLYKVYIVLNRLTYPARVVWAPLKKTGIKVKHFLKKLFGVRPEK